MKKARCWLCRPKPPLYSPWEATQWPPQILFLLSQPEIWNPWATIPATTLGAIFSGGLYSPRLSSTIKTNMLHAFVLIFAHWFDNTQCQSSWSMYSMNAYNIVWIQYIYISHYSFCTFFIWWKTGDCHSRTAGRNVVWHRHCKAKNSKKFQQSNRWRFISANISTCIQRLNPYDESHRK